MKIIKPIFIEIDGKKLVIGTCEVHSQNNYYLKQAWIDKIKINVKDLDYLFQDY